MRAADRFLLSCGPQLFSALQYSSPVANASNNKMTINFNKSMKYPIGIQTFDKIRIGPAVPEARQYRPFPGYTDIFSCKHTLFCAPA